MGYVITKEYYRNSKNKKQAIDDILTLDYSNEENILDFLESSKYNCTK